MDPCVQERTLNDTAHHTHRSQALQDNVGMRRRPRIPHSPTIEVGPCTEPGPHRAPGTVTGMGATPTAQGRMAGWGQDPWEPHQGAGWPQVPSRPLPGGSVSFKSGAAGAE